MRERKTEKDRESGLRDKEVKYKRGEPILVHTYMHIPGNMIDNKSVTHNIVIYSCKRRERERERDRETERERGRERERERQRERDKERESDRKKKQRKRE